MSRAWEPKRKDQRRSKRREQATDIPRGGDSEATANRQPDGTSDGVKNKTTINFQGWSYNNNHHKRIRGIKQIIRLKTRGIAPQTQEPQEKQRGINKGDSTLRKSQGRRSKAQAMAISGWIDKQKSSTVIFFQGWFPRKEYHFTKTDAVPRVTSAKVTKEKHQRVSLPHGLPSILQPRYSLHRQLSTIFIFFTNQLTHNN